MKKLVAIVLVLAMAISMIGCGSTGSTSSESTSKEENGDTKEAASNQADAGNTCGDENGKYTIGVIIHTTTDFLCSKYKSYSDYLGKDYGVKLNYYIIENFADETYLAAIENLCAQGVNGIITTNFSGTAVLQGLKICEENEVYLGVGFSQIDESIKDQVYESQYFVGGSYEADYDAGYEIITSLIDAGCKNIAAIGYEPGITCHDRRWEGMMKAFEDHPEIKKAGEYRGLEFTKAVEDFLASDDTIDGIAITLLGIEYCSEPIKSAGREGEVKIAYCDFSENCQQSLDSGETVCSIGGQYVDVVFPFVLLYNALEGTPLDKVEVPVNFIVCQSGDEFSDYMTYLHNDGVYAFTTDEIDTVIGSKNAEASSQDLLKMGANYSVEDTIARHGK
ncbi:MAG: sugar ABC transporter substrate-binding protein [Velocimicrobium sp.]